MAKKSSTITKKNSSKTSDKWQGCFFYRNGDCLILVENHKRLGLSKKCKPSKICKEGLELAEIFVKLKTEQEPNSLQEDVLRTVGVGPFSNYF